MIQQANRFAFFVEGTPQTQGSTRAFVINGHAVITSDNSKLKPWRSHVASAAIHAGWRGLDLIDGPVALTLTFVLKRPASHFTASGALKKSAPERPHKTGGDLDKLVRAVGDALTGVVWTDDRRIVTCVASKAWGEREGVLVGIVELERKETA